MGERRSLFRIPPSFAGYDVAPDDQRFIVMQGRTGGEASELIVVENWLEELKEKVRND